MRVIEWLMWRPEVTITACIALVWLSICVARASRKTDEFLDAMAWDRFRRAFEETV